jgi:hypothetical protein
MRLLDDTKIADERQANVPVVLPKMQLKAESEAGIRLKSLLFLVLEVGVEESSGEDEE